jgi:hypothetical protein
VAPQIGAGAVQETVEWVPPPDVAVTLVGAPGAPALNDAVADEDAPVPAALVAVTVKV